MLIVAYGCAALNKGPDGTVQNEEDEEMLRIERFKENVRRDGDTLYLKLDSGDYLGLSDLTDCSRWETCTLYRFVDYLEDVGIYLVSVDYYEGFEYLMVSAKSGEKYMVPAFPKFSPDRKRFVAVSADDSGYNENGVFVWRLEDDGIVSELSYRPFDPP
ncbi:MAG: hypothetical protein GWO20_14355, partial [Candidatus Korarchaeota archaeon]|nr:hypothetical protein [Candidatus Korarchaeota archaeon]